MDEMKKYIIEFSEDPHTIKLIKVKNGDKFPITEFKTVKPYTEPDLDAVRNEAYKEAYDKGYQDAVMKISSNEQAIAEKAYQGGFIDAWEAARKIYLPVSKGGLSADVLHIIFGDINTQEIFMKYSASEAIKKIRQYEQEKKEQIQVGDEVMFYNGEKCIVTVVGDGQAAEVMDKGGFSMRMDDGLRISMKKTGRHFSEIAEVLKKMQEEKE